MKIWEPLPGSPNPEKTETDNAVANNAALMDAVSDRRRLNQQRKNAAASTIYTKRYRPGRCICHLSCRIGKPALFRLALQFADRTATVLQVTGVGNDVEKSNTNNIGCDDLAVSCCDLMREAADLARLGYFTLQFKPQALDFLDGRQRARPGHFAAELNQKVFTIRELNVG